MTARDSLVRGFRRARPVLDPPLLLAARGLGRAGHRGVPALVGLTTYAVYRARNAALVEAFLRSLPAGTEPHLHALDEPAERLRRWTRSTGPGSRMHLLQGLLDAHPPAAGRHVLLHDDDVTFVGSGGLRFAGLAARAGLDLAQPAHARGSEHTFYVTAQAPLSTARQTRYVEVGPVVLFSPRAQALVLPFPSEYRMGWGLDVTWSRLREQGLLLGVVDATPVRHHGPVAAAYPVRAEEVLRDAALAAQGLTDVRELAVDVGLTWRPWQVEPGWSR